MNDLGDVAVHRWQNPADGPSVAGRKVITLPRPQGCPLARDQPTLSRPARWPASASRDGTLSRSVSGADFGRVIDDEKLPPLQKALKDLGVESQA